MSLRPPSTSPSPSPAPNGTPKSTARASMGPSGRPSPINLVNPPASPSPNSDRPTSELLGGTDMSQTPECDCSLIFVFEITVSDPFLSKHSRSD